MGQVLLVRHGQASFGAEDYDVLSAAGREQAGVLGRRLVADDRREPDLVVTGDLRRQRDTAVDLRAAAGWSARSGPVQTDPGWDEFDPVGVVAAHGHADMRTMDRRTFQTAFEAATARWAAGEPPLPGRTEPESFAAFTARVSAALERATAQAGPGRTVLVVSSGGPIAIAAARLLGLGADLGAGWARLNTVLVNTGVSTVVVGGTGARLLSYNDHHHLGADQVTYR